MQFNKTQARNDFNEHIDREKFLEQIKVNIDEWMTEKYPAFSKRFEDLASRAILNAQRLEKKFEDFEKTQDQKLKEYELVLSKNITEFLQKDYPDLDGRLRLCVKDIEDNLKKINEKLKKTVKSDKLYEDVYIMKDEIERLRKIVNNFTDGLKKVFGK